ncbi:hypothetical protein [Priestia megaterium]
MGEILIKKYSVEKKDVWNSFVEQAKNGHFLFNRNYMDYHSDRFMDFSLMFYEENKLLAVMPANKDNIGNFVSHAGLTFGGIISSISMTTPKMINLFRNLIFFLKQEGIKTFVYKTIPYIYTSIPSQEDLYALSTFNFVLKRRDVSSTIFLKDRIKFSKGRKHSIAKARRNNVEIRQTTDYKTFIGILKEVLESKYGNTPTHSAEEITLLAQQLPNHIKLYGAFLNYDMIAGIIIYENRKTIHTQYIGANSLGKQIGAVDLIIENLIHEYSLNKEYLDFGISTENAGKYLNLGLINQKEMFGARAIVHDFYELSLNADDKHI